MAKAKRQIETPVETPVIEEEIKSSTESSMVDLRSSVDGFIVVKLTMEVIAACSDVTNKYSRGELFSDADVAGVRTLITDLLNVAMAYKAKATELIGESKQLFAPLANWADSLCVNPNEKARVTSSSNGLDGTMSCVDILRASMTAVLAELTDGREGRKAAKFTAKNAGKAHSMTISGESETIAFQGTLSVIGTDKDGSMAHLADKLHDAVDCLLNGKDDKAVALLASQASFTQIGLETFNGIAQAAIYGRLANRAKSFADSLGKGLQKAPRVPTAR